MLKQNTSVGFMLVDKLCKGLNLKFTADKIFNQKLLQHSKW